MVLGSRPPMRHPATSPRVAHHTQLDLEHGDQDQSLVQSPHLSLPPLRQCNAFTSPLMDSFAQDLSGLTKSKDVMQSDRATSADRQNTDLPCTHLPQNPCSSTSTSSEQIDICSVPAQQPASTTPNIALSSIPACTARPMQAGFKLSQVAQSNNRLKRKLSHVGSPERAPHYTHKSDHCKGSCGCESVFTEHTRAVGYEGAEQQAAAQVGDEQAKQHDMQALRATALLFQARQMASASRQNDLSSRGHQGQSICGSSWRGPKAETASEDWASSHDPQTQAEPMFLKADEQQTAQAAPPQHNVQVLQLQEAALPQQPGQKADHAAGPQHSQLPAQRCKIQAAQEHSGQVLQAKQHCGIVPQQRKLANQRAAQQRVRVPVQRPSSHSVAAHASCQDLQTMRSSALPLQGGRIAQQGTPSCLSSIHHLRQHALRNTCQLRTTSAGKLSFTSVSPFQKFANYSISELPACNLCFHLGLSQRLSLGSTAFSTCMQCMMGNKTAQSKTALPLCQLRRCANIKCMRLQPV